MAERSDFVVTDKCISSLFSVVRVINDSLVFMLPNYGQFPDHLIEKDSNE